MVLMGSSCRVTLATTRALLSELSIGSFMLVLSRDM